MGTDEAGAARDEESHMCILLSSFLLKVECLN
jgi:hypothetical protein